MTQKSKGKTKMENIVNFVIWRFQIDEVAFSQQFIGNSQTNTCGAFVGTAGDV